MATSFKSPLKFVRLVLERLLFILETPLTYLFGRDIFISYSRSDAANYAQNLAIDLREHVPQFSFFLDQWASASGTTLPLTLRLALRWSQLLVFVGTQNAIDSPHVRKELQAFFKRKGRFVPIDVGGALDQAMRKDEFLSAVCGPGSVGETNDNVTASTPSDSVVTRIVNAVNFTRQDRRLRRAVIGTTLGVLAIISTAYFVSRGIVANARTQAQEATHQMNDAQKQRTQALEDLRQAQISTELANAEKTRAEELAKQANEETKRAQALRVEAERLRDQARAAAARQSEIAVARQRANQSERILQQSPTRLAESVSLAVESMERAHAIGIHSLESDRALRGSLSLLPRSLGSPTTIDGVISATAFSPDGKSVAVLSKTDSSEGASVLRVVNAAENREIASFSREWRFIAVSNDSRRVSISNGHSVETRDVSDGKKRVLTLENEDDYITGLALSPNGKYLALILRNVDIETRGFAGVWDVETGKSVGPLQTDRLDMKSVAFSANGSWLAIGGVGYGPGGKPMGRAFVWNLRNYVVQGTLHENHLRERDELFQNENIDAIAVDRGDQFVATASGRLAMVWKKNPGGYHEVARMPIEQRVDELAFSPDGKHLHVLSGGGCQNATADCRRRFLETWESTGYWQVFTVPHDGPIGSMAFHPGDRFITTITDDYGDDNARNWRVLDGEELKDLNVRLGQEPRDASSPTTRYVVTANEGEGTWYVSDALSGAKIPIATTGVEEDTLAEPALSQDASLVAFVGKKKGESGFVVFIYKRDGASYVMSRSFRMATYPTSLALSPANNRFAVSQTVNSDRDLKVFDIKDGRDRTPAELAKLSGVESFEFAPDGSSIAVLFSAGVGETQRNSVGVWRLHDGRQIAMRQGAGLSYSFNSAGDQLAVAMQEDAIELLDVRSGKTNVLPTLRPILLVAFSRDDQLLATADAKGLVTLIELSGLTEVANFQHDSKVSKVVFSKSGKYLATATEPDDRDQASDALHVWLLRPKDLIKEACERLSRLRDTPLSYCARR